LEQVQFENGYVLKVQYSGCTNFEGVKVMVFRGTYRKRNYLDPHFDETGQSPIARFRPDAEGWQMALDLAKSLRPVK
jgi:hypothetical protein